MDNRYRQNVCLKNFLNKIEFYILYLKKISNMTTIKNEQNIKEIKERINNDRTQAFEKFGNKTHISKVLSFTKPCSNVIKKKANGDFGVCYRAECSYAHSKQELKPPVCNFDFSCRFRYGKKTLQGIVPDTECKFLHSDETPEEWMERTKDKNNTDIVELPETNEHSRKPVIKDEKDETIIITIDTENYQELLKTSIENALKDKKFNIKIQLKEKIVEANVETNVDTFVDIEKGI